MKLSIKVVPNAKKDEIIEGTPLIVKTKSPPYQGKANRAVEKHLSKYFNTSVKIIKGIKSKHKVIELGSDDSVHKKNSHPKP
jgi:uncharacterized protein (TIGR00251 family)